MSIIITPSPAVSPTAQAASAPFWATFSWVTGESATGATVNKVLVPNALTRAVLAETDAGVNVVSCPDLSELFNRLDS